MSDTFTPNLNLTKPAVGGSRDTWGTKTNEDWDKVDAVFAGAGTGTSVGLNVGSGKTLSVAGTASISGTLTVSGTATLPAAATAGGATIVTTSGTQTLTNKTLTAPVISQISNTGTLTLPTSTDTLVGRATADTLTNKTLTNPVVNGFTGDTSIVNIGSGQIYKDASGNVGIGTSAPGARLDVAGFTRLGNYGGTFQGLTLQNNNNSASAETVSYIDAQNNLGTADAHTFFGHQTDGGSYVVFGTTPPGSRSSDRRAERFRIGPVGQFGIGGANYGTSGQVLTSNGSGAAPSWQNAGGTVNGLLLNVQVFTSSGTYTRTAGVTRAVVIAMGGGGGGGGTGGGGSAGGTTSFGSHVSAAGGGGAQTFGAAGSGGTGGTGSLISIPGAPGQNVQGSGSVSGSGGGQGGARGVVATNNGIAGTRGGGGSGGSLSTVCGDTSLAGGGQGETAIDYIASGLGATETVTIGGGGAGGTGSRPGGAGGAGYIIVYEYS